MCESLESAWKVKKTGLEMIRDWVVEERRAADRRQCRGKMGGWRQQKCQIWIQLYPGQTGTTVPLFWYSERQPQKSVTSKATAGQQKHESFAWVLFPVVPHGTLTAMSRKEWGMSPAHPVCSLIWWRIILSITKSSFRKVCKVPIRSSVRTNCFVCLIKVLFRLIKISISCLWTHLINYCNYINQSYLQTIDNAGFCHLFWKSKNTW